MDNNESAETSSRTWQTVKVALLDNKVTINKLSEVLRAGFSGANKEHDLKKLGDELLEMLLAELKDSRGVHAPTALAALGALAGFSAQMSLREGLIRPGRLTENQVFPTVFLTKNGDRYPVSDYLNGILFENSRSIVGGILQTAELCGAMKFPDIKEMIENAINTVGTDKFCVPRVPPEHFPRKPVIELLDKFWNPVRNLLFISVTSPLEWPFVISFVISKFIVLSRTAIGPELAAKIAVEAVVPTSRIDPDRIHFAYIQTY
jgi:hypothetical protein